MTDGPDRSSPPPPQGSAPSADSPWLQPPPPSRSWRWAAALFVVTVLVVAAAGAKIGPDVLREQGLPQRRTQASLSAASALVAEAVGARADRGLARGRLPLSPYVLSLPPTFTSADGAFDVAVHLHGNTALVEESYALAGIDAAVVVVNLGPGLWRYRDRLAPPGTLDRLLADVTLALARAGLRDARVRRVALSAWSAGFGGVQSLLDTPEERARVDAVVVLDGVHGAPGPGGRGVALDSLEPLLGFCRSALDGSRMVTLTHSGLEATGVASVRDSIEAIVDALALPWHVAATKAPLPRLRSPEATRGKSRWASLSALGLAHRGGFTARGYFGDTPEHHMGHLIYMSTIALPDLALRWRR